MSAAYKAQLQMTELAAKQQTLFAISLERKSEGYSHDYRLGLFELRERYHANAKRSIPNPMAVLRSMWVDVSHR